MQWQRRKQAMSKADWQKDSSHTMHASEMLQVRRARRSQMEERLQRLGVDVDWWAESCE